jgi:hypothetical protein
VSSQGNGKPAAANSETNARVPRRIVLLEGEENSSVRQVLAEYQGERISGRRLHVDMQRLAAEHRGHLLAAEWLGPLGWTRFVWCRKASD